jgi:hypothetical protein
LTQTSPQKSKYLNGVEAADDGNCEGGTFIISLEGVPNGEENPNIALVLLFEYLFTRFSTS